MLATTAIDTRSNIPRPSGKELSSFHLGMVKSDRTVRWFLEKGASLAICCKDCRRMTEWTPFDLEQRFGARLDTRIRAIAERLTCAGEGGCGSHDIAAWPWPYAGEWTWPHPAGEAVADDGPQPGGDG